MPTANRRDLKAQLEQLRIKQFLKVKWRKALEEAARKEAKTSASTKQVAVKVNPARKSAINKVAFHQLVSKASLKLKGNERGRAFDATCSSRMSMGSHTMTGQVQRCHKAQWQVHDHTAT